MPFKSLAQMHYLFAKEPKIAREFASKTHNMKLLPKKILKMKKHK
jgi:hypothetical protein